MSTDSDVQELQQHISQMVHTAIKVLEPGERIVIERSSADSGSLYQVSFPVKDYESR